MKSEPQEALQSLCPAVLGATVGESIRVVHFSHHLP